MFKTLSVIFVAMLALATPTLAQDAPIDITIGMWNSDPNDKSRKMVFSEDIVTVTAGATITWVPTAKGHNVEFVHGPDGVELPAKSKLNQEYSYTFETPGVYVYVCTPHASMGMIGVVLVGETTPEQIAAALEAKVSGNSKKKLESLLTGL